MNSSPGNHFSHTDSPYFNSLWFLCFVDRFLRFWQVVKKNENNIRSQWLQTTSRPHHFFFLLSQDACTFLEVWIFYGFKNSTGLTSETKIPTGWHSLLFYLHFLFKVATLLFDIQGGRSQNCNTNAPCLHLPLLLALETVACTGNPRCLWQIESCMSSS